MEEIKDKSIHHTALRLCEDLKQNPTYKGLYTDVQVNTDVYIIHA